MIRAAEVESLGFVKTETMGWAKYRKNNFELVEVPTNKGLLIAFEHTFNSQAKYKFLKMSELEQLYFILTGKNLKNEKTT